jgi:hypothetical protein
MVNSSTINNQTTEDNLQNIFCDANIDISLSGGVFVKNNSQETVKLNWAGTAREILSQDWNFLQIPCPTVIHLFNYTAYTFVPWHIHLYLNIYICTLTYIFVPWHIHLYLDIYICTLTYTFVPWHIHLYLDIYIYIRKEFHGHDTPSFSSGSVFLGF